jgi:hypothetical protein
MEKPTKAKRSRNILILLLLIFGTLLIWQGPITIYAKYMRFLVFHGGSNNFIDGKVRFVFQEGATAIFSRPLFRMADAATTTGGSVTYCFGYRGRNWREGDRYAQVTVDTNTFVITKVYVGTWIR